MSGDDDLKRKDDHLGQYAALCFVETGIRVEADVDGVTLDIGKSNGEDVGSYAVRFSPFHAILLSDALLEASADAELSKGKWA